MRGRGPKGRARMQGMADGYPALGPQLSATPTGCRRGTVSSSQASRSGPSFSLARQAGWRGAGRGRTAPAHDGTRGKACAPDRTVAARIRRTRHLARDPDGRFRLRLHPRNWALANGRRDRRWCGSTTRSLCSSRPVLLRRLHLSLGARRNPAPTSSNRIYWPRGDLHRARL